MTLADLAGFTLEQYLILFVIDILAGLLVLAIRR